MTKRDSVITKLLNLILLSLHNTSTIKLIGSTSYRIVIVIADYKTNLVYKGIVYFKKKCIFSFNIGVFRFQKNANCMT